MKYVVRFQVLDAHGTFLYLSEIDIDTPLDLDGPNPDKVAAARIVAARILLNEGRTVRVTDIRPA